MQEYSRGRRERGPSDPIAGGLARDPLRRDRSDGIDVLRALCALWVVLAHLIPWSELAQGPEAVPVWLAASAHSIERVFQPVGELHPAVVAFIVLSGYCIHRSGLRAPGAGEIAGYAIRRFFRIIPIYYIAIAAGLVGIVVAGWQAPALAAALSGAAPAAGICIAAKALVLSAFFPGWHECGYLGNAPLATVLVEIVLYILYPVAFAGLVWRGRERVVWIVCVALFVGSLAMLGFGVAPGFYGWWQNGSVFGFLPYWWLGVAFVNPGLARACARRWWLIGAAWIALTTALLLGQPPAVLAVAELRKLCFALAAGVLIFLVDNVRLRRVNALACIGRAGYGLYALHAPLTYTLVIYGASWWMILIANVVTGLIVHWAIERPLIDLGRVLRRRFALPLAMDPIRAAQ